MPLYTYRRADGSTFDIRQSFNDAPLQFDPQSGQTVVRLVQAAGVIFKGSGFYVNDSKGAKSSTSVTKGEHKDAKPEASSGESKAEGSSSAAPATTASSTPAAAAD